MLLLWLHSPNTNFQQGRGEERGKEETQDVYVHISLKSGKRLRYFTFVYDIDGEDVEQKAIRCVKEGTIAFVFVLDVRKPNLRFICDF